MIKRIPVLPTLIVLAAVAVMIALGVWQLNRSQEKAALLALYAAAPAMSAEVPWPATPVEAQRALFRQTTIQCVAVSGRGAMAGHDAHGRNGWAQTARCKRPADNPVDIVMGWSANPDADVAAWRGGRVSGIIAPGAGKSVRLVAQPPLAGLAANAAPDPRAVPNNHLSYAIQWFLFAATALAIYLLALRKRLPPADLPKD